MTLDELTAAMQGAGNAKKAAKKTAKNAAKKAGQEGTSYGLDLQIRRNEREVGTSRRTVCRRSPNCSTPTTTVI